MCRAGSSYNNKKKKQGQEQKIKSQNEKSKIVKREKANKNILTELFCCKIVSKKLKLLNME